MKQIQIYLISLIFLLVTGCTMYSPEDLILVTLPDIPPHWEQRFREVVFSIEYPEISGGKKKVPLPAGVSSCTIRVPKMRNWPVIACPYGDGFPLRPAGALYPWHLDKGSSRTLQLSWEQGFSALLLAECLEKGCDITGFNALRLASEVPERSDGDPWKLDYPFIAEKIASGSFRVNYIKLLPARDMTLCMDKGKWFFSSPFSPVYNVEEEGPFCFKTIPLGFHRLFHCDSPGWYELFVSEQEIIGVYYGE